MKVKELLDSPEKWTQGALSRDSLGADLDTARSARSVCWCLMGAVEKCYPSQTAVPTAEFTGVRSRILAAIGVSSVVFWNDERGRTFEDVQELVNELDI